MLQLHPPPLSSPLLNPLGRAATDTWVPRHIPGPPPARGHVAVALNRLPPHSHNNRTERFALRGRARRRILAIASEVDVVGDNVDDDRHHRGHVQAAETLDKLQRERAAEASRKADSEQGEERGVSIPQTRVQQHKRVGRWRKGVRETAWIFFLIIAIDYTYILRYRVRANKNCAVRVLANSRTSGADFR